MSWNLSVGDEYKKKILKPIIDSSVETIEDLYPDYIVGDNGTLYTDGECGESLDVYDTIWEQIDGTLVYTVDQLSTCLYYDHVNDGYNAAYEDLEADVAEKVERELIDRFNLKN